VVACAGVSKKEYGDKSLSDEIERVCEGRTMYVRREGDEKLSPLSDGGSHYVTCAMPIISEGDVVGCVAALASQESDIYPDAVETKLIQTAAGFLGRQLEG
jgi:AbrB family transcriptional regulator (stage V sporulation protein T)